MITTVSAKDTFYARSLGAYGVIDYRARRFEEQVKEIDAVLDTVGGDTLERSYGVLKGGGIIISPAAPPSKGKSGAIRRSGSVFPRPGNDEPIERGRGKIVIKVAE